MSQNFAILSFLISPGYRSSKREIEDHAYAKFEKVNKEKVYYGRCANGWYRLEFTKISRWKFGMCICALYSIQCNRPSDERKSKRLSTTSEFERFYKESRYWLISFAAVFVSPLKGRESRVTSGGSEKGARWPALTTPPYFKTKLRPEGPKKFWGENAPSPPPPPLSEGLDDRPPHISSCGWRDKHGCEGD